MPYERAIVWRQPLYWHFDAGLFQHNVVLFWLAAEFQRGQK